MGFSLRQDAAVGFAAIAARPSVVPHEAGFLFFICLFIYQLTKRFLFVSNFSAPATRPFRGGGDDV
jgi:hypothetical protein